MNKVVLMGRLTKDPVIHQPEYQEGTTVARYTLAVDRRRSRQQDQQQTDFISCVAFGKAAEWAEKYLHKGTKLTISGRIQTGSYTKQDGTKVYTTDVIAEEQEFAESKAASQNCASANAEQTEKPARQQDAMDGFMNIPEGVDEELPFS